MSEELERFVKWLKSYQHSYLMLPRTGRNFWLDNKLKEYEQEQKKKAAR